MEDVFVFLKKTIAKLTGINEDDIALRTSIRGEIAASSLDLMNIMSAIEKEYQIKISWHRIKDIDTIEDLAKWVISL